MVHCHAYLHFEFYQPGMGNMGKQMSPLYFLKLKKGGLAAMVGDGLQAGLAVGCILTSVLWALSHAAAAYEPPDCLPHYCRRWGWRGAARAW